MEYIDNGLRTTGPVSTQINIGLELGYYMMKRRKERREQRNMVRNWIMCLYIKFNNDENP